MRLLAGALVALALAAPLPAPPSAAAEERPAPGAADASGDLAAARALFEANLGAIRDRDRDAYLAWGQVKVTIWTHKIDGLTESDFVFAAKADRAL